MSEWLRNRVQWGACLAWIVGFGLVGENARASQAGGGLLIAPTRVVFEGSQRSAALTLINIGNEVATYRISFIQMEMTEAGQIVEIKEDEADGPRRWRADRLVRYSPRQVTLKPHTPQTVRMRLRKPAELAPGEYRSHLLFRAIPSAKSFPTLIESSKPGSDSVIQIELIPVYGLAIPVIVRHGKTAATARLTNLSLRAPPQGGADPPILSLQISRDGNRSVCGNVTVTHVNVGGQEHVIGRVDRVAVYTPTALRRLDVPLKPPPGLTLKNGRLRVTYTEMGETNKVLADAEIILEARPETKPVMVEKP